MKDVWPVERRPLVCKEDVDTIVSSFADQGLRITPDHAEAVWLLYSQSVGQLWCSTFTDTPDSKALVTLLNQFYIDGR